MKAEDFDCWKLRNNKRSRFYGELQGFSGDWFRSMAKEREGKKEKRLSKNYND